MKRNIKINFTLVSIFCLLYSSYSMAIPIYTKTYSGASISETYISQGGYDGGTFSTRGSYTDGFEFQGVSKGESGYSFHPSNEYAWAKATVQKIHKDFFDETPTHQGMGGGTARAHTSVTYSVTPRALSDLEVDYVPIFAEWTTLIDRDYHPLPGDVDFGRPATGHGARYEARAYIQMTDLSKTFNHHATTLGVETGIESFSLGHRGLSVILDAYAFAQSDKVNGSGMVVMGHAYADPKIYIDPSWEHASLFSLEFNASGIADGYLEATSDTGNSPSSVHEPSSAALLCLALIFLYTSKSRDRTCAQAVT